MTTKRTYVLGLKIEGVGDSSVNQGEQVIWSSNDLDLPQSIPLLMSEGDHPTVSDETDPYTGEFRSSRFTFRFHASDEVAETFMYQPKTSSTGQMRLNEPVGASDTEIRVIGPDTIDWQSLEGLLLYMGTETLYVISLDGISSKPDSLEEAVFTVSRGRAGSLRSPHSDRQLIFLKPPFWKGRRTDLYVYLDGQERKVWQGFLSESPVMDGPIISLTCSSVMDVLKEMSFNENPQAYEGLGSSLRVRDEYGTTVLEGQVPPEFLPSVYKWDSPHWDQIRVTAWRAGEGSLLVSLQNQFINATPLLGSLPLEGIEEGSFDYQWDGRLREVMVISKTLDADFIYRYGFPISPTFGCKYPYHPLTIVACLLLSSGRPTGWDPDHYQVFGSPSWALDARWLFHSSIYQDLDRLIEETRELEIDTLIWGWEGTPLKAWNQIRDLLSTYGFYLGMTPEGSLTFKSLEAFDVLEWEKALKNPIPLYDDRLRFDTGSRSSVDRITADVGYEPWAEPARVVVNTLSLGRDTRSRALGQVRDHHYEVRTISRNEASSYAQNRLQHMATLRSWNLPRLEVRVPYDDIIRKDHNLSYDIGSLIALEGYDFISTYLVDSSGKRVRDISGEVQWGATIIARQLNTEDLSYNLRLLLTNFRMDQVIRHRAPAYVNELFNTTTGSLRGAATSLFGLGSNDREFFGIGDKVRIYDHRGTLKGPEIFEIVDSYDAIGVPWVKISPIPPWPVNRDDVIRLLPSDSFEGSHHPDYQDIEKPFADFSNNQGLIPVYVSGQIEMWPSDLYG